MLSRVAENLFRLKPPVHIQTYFLTMSTTVPRDVALFLEEYPHGGDIKSQSANLEFYTLKRRCRPDNLLVDEIHSKYVLRWWVPELSSPRYPRWAGDYRTLEYNHGFIQWLYVVLLAMTIAPGSNSA